MSKPGTQKPLQQPPPEEAGQDKPQDEPFAEQSTAPTRFRDRLAKWPKKPKIIQLNVDRIEISIPYQLAIAILLGIILLLLVVFRLGQMTSPATQKETDSAAKMPKNTQKMALRPTPVVPPRLAATEEIAALPASAEKTGPVSSTGNNRIVIQTYQLRTHLEPVKQYFAQFGIETEIKKIDVWYYLVTKNKYDNPEKQGTDGYLAKQKIIEWGAKYRAPTGYETFGTKPFHDAYGMKFDE
ncbi:MAG: hypothetical protein ACYS0C_06345 [Planctomycetota bacterium]